jgi:hypothetical protein
VLAPFVLLFAGFGGWMLVQRLLQPAVHLDCVARCASGPCTPDRRERHVPHDRPASQPAERARRDSPERQAMPR